VSDVPPLARGTLNRAAHRRLDREWLEAAWLKARIVVVDDGHVLVQGDTPTLVFVDASAAPAGERLFMGEEPDGTVYFAVSAALEEPATAPQKALRRAPADITAGEETRRVNLRQVGHKLSDLDAGLFITAVALANWHARHPFSPLSGSATTVGEGGWTRVTADGTETMWPRTDPAVIMLVHDAVDGPEGRCLLGCNAAWPELDGIRRYSTLAGFVEPGESAEAAVAREVAEEVGVEVSAIRYVASQPWPFPGSLMLGFHAQCPPGAPVRVDQSEILEARWFTRDEIAAVINRESTAFGLPFPASIAFFLITEWLAGRAR
jgi:NAD+ diphosphatase